MAEYEVWCHTCNVTFPPGQKHCLHCGGRTRVESPNRRMRHTGEPELFGVAPLMFGNEVASAPELPDFPVSQAAVEPEAQPARRSILRAGMTVMWMVLLAGGYAWRACSQ